MNDVQEKCMNQLVTVLGMSFKLIHSLLTITSVNNKEWRNKCKE